MRSWLVSVAFISALTAGACTGSDKSEVTVEAEQQEVSSELQELVGSTLEDFSTSAAELGYTVRVIERNGEPVEARTSYEPLRVNVAVDADDIVLEARSMG